DAIDARGALAMQLALRQIAAEVGLQQAARHGGGADALARHGHVDVRVLEHRAVIPHDAPARLRRPAILARIADADRDLERCPLPRCGTGNAGLRTVDVEDRVFHARAAE